jgi:2-amino-4-hydroxy-6-hydroxymethyldihydropteridine diphosphokinase
MSLGQSDWRHGRPFAGSVCFSGVELTNSLAPRCLAWVALGANLGDPIQALNRAAQGISGLPWTHLVAGSSLYRTRPVDACGPDYINAVIAVQTALGPLELLHALQALELDQGRERPYRNAPRTLDLDLIWQGGTVRDTPELVLPHPRYLARAFVIEPLAEAIDAVIARRAADDIQANGWPEVWAQELPEMPAMAVRRALSLAQGIEKTDEIWFAGPKTPEKLAAGQKPE